MAILPLPLIQEEQFSVNGERMCAKYWLPASERLARNSVDRITDGPDMTSAVDRGLQPKQTNKQTQMKHHIISGALLFTLVPKNRMLGYNELTLNARKLAS